MDVWIVPVPNKQVEQSLTPLYEWKCACEWTNVTSTEKFCKDFVYHSPLTKEAKLQPKYFVPLKCESVGQRPNDVVLWNLFKSYSTNCITANTTDTRLLKQKVSHHLSVVPTPYVACQENI